MCCDTGTSLPLESTPDSGIVILDTQSLCSSRTALVNAASDTIHSLLDFRFIFLDCQALFTVESTPSHHRSMVNYQKEREQKTAGELMSVALVSESVKSRVIQSELERYWAC